MYAHTIHTHKNIYMYTYIHIHTNVHVYMCSVICRFYTYISRDQVNVICVVVHRSEIRCDVCEEA